MPRFAAFSLAVLIMLPLIVDSLQCYKCQGKDKDCKGEDKNKVTCPAGYKGCMKITYDGTTRRVSILRAILVIKIKRLY